MVQLLPLLGDIVEPEDEDARPEGDGESDEEQGDQVLHGCKHEDDFIKVPLTAAKEDVDEVAKIQLIRYLPSCKDETLTCGNGLYPFFLYRSVSTYIYGI